MKSAIAGVVALFIAIPALATNFNDQRSGKGGAPSFQVQQGTMEAAGYGYAGGTGKTIETLAGASGTGTMWWNGQSPVGGTNGDITAGFGSLVTNTNGPSESFGGLGGQYKVKQMIKQMGCFTSACD